MIAGNGLDLPLRLRGNGPVRSPASSSLVETGAFPGGRNVVSIKQKTALLVCMRFESGEIRSGTTLGVKREMSLTIAYKPTHSLSVEHQHQTSCLLSSPTDGNVPTRCAAHIHLYQRLSGDDSDCAVLAISINR